MPRPLVYVSRDEIKGSIVDSAPVARPNMFSSSVDGRTQNYEVDNIPSSNTLSPLEVYSNGLKVYVYPGTIAGEMPKISGTALDDATPPYVTLSGSGNEYIVVSITGTWVLTSDNLFAKQLTPRTVTIDKTTTLPTSADLLSKSSGGTFKFLLAKYVNGLFSFQNGFGPIGCYFEDDASNSGKLNCNPRYPGQD